MFANLKFNRIAERAGFKILGDYLMVGTNKWTFMDRNNKSKKLFDEYCPCETVTKKDIKALKIAKKYVLSKAFFHIVMGKRYFINGPFASSRFTFLKIKRIK